MGISGGEILAHKHVSERKGKKKTWNKPDDTKMQIEITTKKRQNFQHFMPITPSSFINSIASTFSIQNSPFSSILTQFT